MEKRVYTKWPSTIPEARKLQEKIRRQVNTTDSLDLETVSSVTGVDLSYRKEDATCFAALTLFSYPGLELQDEIVARCEVGFPYVPGFLAFREGPAIEKAFTELGALPDAALFDGQGIAHPRGVGIASHLGVLLGIPSVGVAKTVLVGDYAEPSSSKGSYEKLNYKEMTVGAAVRTRSDVKPVFVSPGHLIDLATSIRLVLSCTDRYRLPEPLRQAHLLAARAKKLP